jgi:hypothetical protein
VDDAGLPETTLYDLLTHRKAAMAVTATFLGLDDGFIGAILSDEMDEWLCEQAPARDRLRVERYDEYLLLLGREITVRYAATAAEGLVDDANAIARIHEIFEHLESPDASEDAETILQVVKRQLCNYYNACAYTLVKATLLPVIIDTAEELYKKGSLTPAQVKELVIAEQER